MQILVLSLKKMVNCLPLGLIVLLVNGEESESALMAVCLCNCVVTGFEIGTFGTVV